MSRDTRVKICGVTALADALLAARAGADMLGLNFFPDSPRYLLPVQAADICATLRAELAGNCPVLVGVFVNEAPQRMAAICAQVGLDGAQLSGDETPDDLRSPQLAGLHAFKSLRPRSVAGAQEQARRYCMSPNCAEELPALLLDAWHPDLYGGSGVQASEDVARTLIDQVPRLMLAGGLNPVNVGERVRALQPWGVDVASGVERAPGVKDAGKLRAFIAAAKGLT